MKKRGLWSQGVVLALGLCTAWAAWANTSLVPRPAPVRPYTIHANMIDLARNGDAIFAIGDWGVILKSEDGGESWVQKPSPISVMLNKIQFIDQQHGWIVGHDASILVTRDGGESWSIQYRDAEWGKPIYDLVMLDADNGIAVGANGRMLQTTDGGDNWEMIEPDIAVNGTNFYGINTLADGTLFIHGEKGILARSTDGGETWEQLFSPYSGSFFGMLPFGDKGAYVFGLRGTVYAFGDISALPALDPYEWDEFALETITDASELAPLGVRYYENDLKESLFGGDNLGGNDVLMVGVNGAIVRNEGDRIAAIPTDVEMSLADALVTDKGLVTVGLGGVTRVPFRK